MKYTIEQLMQAGQAQQYLYFWGHRPAKDGIITKSCFSQWWPATFTVDGKNYATAEHWMMEQKALLFGDEAIALAVLAAKTPAEAKKLGREVKNYDEAIWLAHRYEIVVHGNYHKFSQHAALKEFLCNTKDRVLVEASPVDAIWGIGMAEDHPEILQPKQWRGLNLLGFALMEVRDKIQQQ
ncbi:DUF1768 domain-containing protein [Taibaiella sp. KBW10]|uniref:NADAR family protein n=1 Tax=Taibaiella sp. KBW10 TaxID=2153357 RepID=UPI000F5AE4A3|nr:NADAR family protein [Taibaiella sp. KBW10]RQO32276.1 DUF1768 domain-containing protein [Taibaiella sp. KBW10]